MTEVSHPRRVRLYALIVLLAPISGAGFRQAPSRTQEVSKPESPAAAWKEVDRLLSEQKAAEAQKRVDAILASARRRGDEENWTRALVRHAQIETALHGYETAVRFLKEEKRPPGLLSRVVLDLFEAETLVAYARAYSWEIGQRERVEPPSSDPKAWTREQIFDRARRAYADAWERRAELAMTPDTRLSEYLEKNGYPPGVRSTLRDALTYLFVELLSDTSGWTPAQSNSVAGLSLTRLLSEEGDASRSRLEDPAVHPVEKVVAVLADLESWHLAAGRREAALEARLERLRRLHASFTQEEDRAAIRKDLEERLGLGAPSGPATSRPALRDLPWWSMGMAVLAEFREAGTPPTT